MDMAYECMVIFWMYWFYLGPPLFIFFLAQKGETLKNKKYTHTARALFVVYMVALFPFFSRHSVALLFSLVALVIWNLAIPAFFLWHGKKTRNYVLVVLMAFFLLFEAAFLTHSFIVQIRMAAALGWTYW